MTSHRIKIITFYQITSNTKYYHLTVFQPPPLDREFKNQTLILIRDILCFTKAAMIAQRHPNKIMSVVICDNCIAI